MALPYSTEPIIYDLFEPSTGVWQYVVADPNSHHCVIIDPILIQSTREDGPDDKFAADAILELVRSHGYLVDRLLTTDSSSNSRRTAIWYLRMQLLEKQGYAPKVAGGKLVSQFANRFERKFGPQSGFTSTCDEYLEDGMTMRVGSLQIRAMHLPGLAPGNFGYLIGQNIFGAMAVCRCAQAARSSPGKASDTSFYLLTGSLEKVLALPRSFRLLPGE